MSVDAQLLLGVLNFIGVEEGDVKAKVDSKFHGELVPGNLNLIKIDLEIYYTSIESNHIWVQMHFGYILCTLVEFQYK